MRQEVTEKGQTLSDIKLLRDNDDFTYEHSVKICQGQFFNCLTMTKSHKVKLAIS